jgi:Mg-chelatase subunit ChlD
VPLFLPVALREAPCKDVRRVALAPVVDTSSSMLGETSGGRTKLQAAIEGAGSLLDNLSFPQDQAAVIGFDSDVHPGQLASDRATLDAQLAGLQPGLGTRVQAGIAAAHAELESPRRRGENFSVMVVLTDGRSEGTAEEIMGVAALAKEAGIALFTIGLGADVDAEQLRQIASRPEWYYEAADAEDLRGVYRTVAIAIPCPGSVYWGGRP